MNPATDPVPGPHRPDAPAAFVAAALIVAACVAFAALFAGGCATGASRRSDAAAPHPLVVGERIRVVAPGETLVVPAPVPPARTWYLADDEGLWQWLGIRAPNRVFVTNDDQRVTLRRRLSP